MGIAFIGENAVLPTIDRMYRMRPKWDETEQFEFE